MTLAFGGMYSSLVLIPLWLPLNMGYTATGRTCHGLERSAGGCVLTNRSLFGDQN